MEKLLMQQSWDLWQEMEYNVKVIASGPFAKEFAELKVYGMNITVVGSENGQASGIKLLRSAYTKGVSALLFESIYSAYKMGMDREVLEYISETEGNEFYGICSIKDNI